MKKIFTFLLAASAFLAAGNFQNIKAQSWSLTGNAGTVSPTNFLGTTDNKALLFRTNNIERMRIAAAGNLGIGTKSPAAKLNVDGGSPVSLLSPGYVVIGNTGSTNMGLDGSFIQARFNGTASDLYLNFNGGTTYIGNSSSSGYGVFARGNSCGVYGYSPTIGTYGSSVYSSGIYGFAENDGGYNSKGVVGYGNYGVWGTTRDNSLYYAGYFEGDVYTTGTYYGSDQKLKRNIQDFSRAMDIINQLHPKQYDFRHDGNYKLMNLPQGNHYGLIAQDVEKVLPNLVKDTKFDAGKAIPFKPSDSKNETEQKPKNSEIIDFKALNYTELIPIMIKGMQEQEQTISQLQQQVSELKQIVQLLQEKRSSTTSAINAYLNQNTPNPFSADTKIQCTIPASVKSAMIIVSTADGKQLQSYPITTKGTAQVTIHGSTLNSGQYLYSLVADGKLIDTKTMILTK